MLDFNFILLLIAFLSPLVVLARTWRRRATQNRGWRLAAVAVLLVTAVAWLVTPGRAGYVGGGAWLFLLFLPAAGLRRAAELAGEERYAGARRLVRLLIWVHPARSLREEHRLLQGLELAQRGDLPAAGEILHQLAAHDTRAGRQAAAESFRIRGDWLGLLAWCRLNLPRVGLGKNPTLLLLYFRALGETGALDELVLQFAGRSHALLASPLYQPTFDVTLLLVLAFCGRTAAVERLLRTRLPGLSTDPAEFWTATCEFSAGQESAARTRWQRLRITSSDALIRADCERRLGSRTALSLAAVNLPNEGIVRRMERHLERPRASFLAPPSRRPTPAVAVFLALNVAMFGLEIACGGSTNVSTLHRLGALEPFNVVHGHQYWRLLTSLFLHYGLVHLLVNAYALYVIGPSLEISLGATRFAIGYLGAGFGSGAGVILLSRLGWTRSDFLVGASGCVMGLVGAWAGLLLRNRHAPFARTRLMNILVIVIMQSLFDLWTPQVSMAAHLCGLLTGLVIGLCIAPRSEPTDS